MYTHTHKHKHTSYVYSPTLVKVTYANKKIKHYHLVPA